jgi:hypothetical protein
MRHCSINLRVQGKGLKMQEDVLALAYEVSRVTEEKIDRIETVMRQTQLLAINARIEAARAGASGAAFSVVAQEMASVAGDISRLSGELREAIGANMARLSKVGTELTVHFRGSRFADLSLNAIEIIDRNLYERSCDVRWWATDAAVVEAVEHPSSESAAFAASRLGTILRSYTVYLDLWIADASGQVVANGRPERYPGVVGADVSGAEWFRSAMATASGDDFAVSDIQRNGRLGEAAVATYSTAIRRGGAASGRALGVLGIFFDWGPQATTVVEGVGLNAEEKAQSRVLLLDAAHRVIASSDSRGVLSETYPLETGGRERGYYQKGDRIIGFALTPGYETYKGLGWYGVIDGPASSERSAAWAKAG